MMVNQEETIKSLQNEVLRLKLTCHNYEQQLTAVGRSAGKDLDETKRDLIADLMEANDELKNKLNEQTREELPDRPEMVETACQTNLDQYGIGRLIEDSLSLKKQKKLHSELTEQFQQVKQSLLYHQTIIHQTQQQQKQQEELMQQQQKQQQQQQHHHHHQQHKQQQQQQTRQQPQTPIHACHHQSQSAKALLREPTFRKDCQTLPRKLLTLDEKGVLDKLFKLDGMLTTARDKLRAAALN